VGWGRSWAERGGERVGRDCRLGQREEERGQGRIWAFGPKIEREGSSFFILLFQSLFKNQFLKPF